MKKITRSLTSDDVRFILDTTLRETGLDQVPKRLDLLDKILTSVDKLVFEVKGYREEQELNSSKLSLHDDELEKNKFKIDLIEKHIHLASTP